MKILDNNNKNKFIFSYLHQAALKFIRNVAIGKIFLLP